MRFTRTDPYGKSESDLSIMNFAKEINGLEFPKLKNMEVGDIVSFSRPFGFKILKFERTD